jgi:hypothetical protein
MNGPDTRYPTPAQAAAALSQIPLERLATAEDEALARLPLQRRRRMQVAPVLRMARRAGRRP